MKTEAERRMPNPTPEEIARRLRPAHIHCLAYIARFGADFHPSSHMRHRDLLNPGSALRRLGALGLAEAGAIMPDGRCYRVTDLGRAVADAIRADHQQEKNDA